MIIPKNYRLSIYSLHIVTFFLFLCTPFMSYGEIMDNQKELASISKDQWDFLANKSIYFGHQSVGSNIMDGVQSILEQNPSIKINIVKYKKDLEIKDSSFVDNNNLGTNNDPESKINQFVSDVSNKQYDIAFMKFCFDDIHSKTDIDKMFYEYKRAILTIRKKHPDLIIIHFTVPLLEKEDPSVKSWLKKLLGMSGGYFDNSHNVARNNFNNLLINEYEGKEPIFDLAKYESTHLNGNRETFVANGNEYFSLVPKYTDDRAHLNEKARQYIAEKLLIFLSEVL